MMHLFLLFLPCEPSSAFLVSWAVLFLCLGQQVLAPHSIAALPWKVDKNAQREKYSASRPQNSQTVLV